MPKDYDFGRYLFAILSWRLLYHIHTHTIRSLYLEVLVKYLSEAYKISLHTPFRKEIIEAKHILLANIFYFYEICIWSNISLFIGIKPQKKNEIKLFHFSWIWIYFFFSFSVCVCARMCVRVLICSTRKVRCLPQLGKSTCSDNYMSSTVRLTTQLINTRTLGHTHKWLLHACRHTHTQTPTQTHSYTCVSQNCSPAGVDSSICREREK